MSLKKKVIMILAFFACINVTVILVTLYLMMEGVLIRGVPNPNFEPLHMAIMFSFMGGVFTIILLDELKAKMGGVE